MALLPVLLLPLVVLLVVLRGRWGKRASQLKLPAVVASAAAAPPLSTYLRPQ
jgi:hypothetical protein